ncbi:MAG: hypothetical protein KTR21_02285 [Rhodobacteraceae bacterium]|nr:hypothetical protein [Paracoccaceae bacterium]
MRSIVKGFSIIGFIAAFAGHALAADFNTQIDTLTQTNNAQNSLALAIGGSKAAAGANLACGTKTKRVTQTNNSQNALALAILGSTSIAGSNSVGKCLK